ncbi:MAG TPA: hypothetical protein VF845_13065 [Terriglobales bacterium]
MAQQLSTYLGIKSDDLENAGILDTVIGVDTHLFVDPLLLSVAKALELKNSRQKVEKHYEEISSGYDARVLVEIKLSSNTRLVQGFENQLPAYEKSENTTSSFCVVIRVTESDKQIKQVQKIYNKAKAAGKKVPKLVIIDAMEKPSASKR